MKTQKEVENYILQKAKEHEKAEDEWEYDDIEITSYREVIRFCLGKGFTLEKIDFDVFLNEINAEDDGFDCWYYFDKILEIVEQMDVDNELPYYVKHLHEFWENSFWPELFSDRIKR